MKIDQSKGQKHNVNIKESERIKVKSEGKTFYSTMATADQSSHWFLVNAMVEMLPLGETNGKEEDQNLANAK